MLLLPSHVSKRVVSVKFLGKKSLSDFSKILPGRKNLLAPNLKKFATTNSQIFSKSEIEEVEFEEFGTFRAEEVQISESTSSGRERREDTGSGAVLTDHMLVIDWTQTGGWHRPQILPVAPIKINPGASSLQYGMSCYGDLNVYKNRETGQLQAFQPDLSLHAMLNSTHCLAMPLFEMEELFKCFAHMVGLDKQWYPSEEDGGHLHIRTCHYSTDSSLAPQPPRSSTMFCLMRQVPGGQLFRGQSLKCSDQ